MEVNHIDLFFAPCFLHSCFLTELSAEWALIHQKSPAKQIISRVLTLREGSHGPCSQWLSSPEIKGGREGAGEDSRKSIAHSISSWVQAHMCTCMCVGKDACVCRQKVYVCCLSILFSLCLKLTSSRAANQRLLWSSCLCWDCRIVCVCLGLNADPRVCKATTLQTEPSPLTSFHFE